MLNSTEALEKIEISDISIFTVPTSTYPEDKSTLLKIQQLAQSETSGYNFLEVGSYRGGALVPHLLSPLCKAVYSIDKRPKSTPDERGISFSYEEVSTRDMIGFLLEQIPESHLSKLHTFDEDASEAVPRITEKIDFAFIDGEHTVKATIRDFLSVYPCLSDNAFVAFHDANLIIDAIHSVKLFLDYLGISAKVFFLPQVVAVIAIGDYVRVAEAKFASIAYDEKAFELKSKSDLHEEFVAHKQAAKTAHEALMASQKP
jgi:hypothetical protein